MTDTTPWGPGIPRCERCDREAVTADDRGNLLCARHALIFMTAKRFAAASEERRKSA